MHWIIRKKAVHLHFSNLVVIVDPFRETTGKWSLNENWKQFFLRLISVCFDKTIFMDKLDPFLTLLCWSPTGSRFLFSHKIYLIFRNIISRNLSVVLQQKYSEN